MSAPGRFYAAVSVAAAPGGFALTLDGRTARTPGGTPLLLPNEALARMVAAEWEAQGERIEFVSMPATGLAFGVLDAPEDAREAWAGTLVEFTGHDLLCYFATGPEALVTRQEATWTPLLFWARRHGLDLIRTFGVIHVDQPPGALAAARALALGRDNFALAALAQAARLTGSAVLGLALAAGRLTGAEAIAAARLDDIFQAQQWGEDREAAEAAAALGREAEMLEAWSASLPG